MPRKMCTVPFAAKNTGSKGTSFRLSSRLAKEVHNPIERPLCGLAADCLVCCAVLGGVMSPNPLFHDRVQAGRVLAGRLTKGIDDRNTIVLALPRGGVP